MKVNIISKKLIKPNTPTPKNLSTYKISYWDESFPPMNIGIILYYTSKPEKISQLEDSLTRILSQFYPLAGRYIKKDGVVDCNDEGAEFVRAEAVDVELCDVVEKSATLEELRGLLPHQYYQIDEAVATPLLSVQITGFNCGGVAMGVSISHRIFDLSSVGTFITAWRNANNPAAAGGGGEIAPSLDGPMLFPAAAKVERGHPFDRETFPEFVAKRYVFDKEAIASLRSKLKSNNNDDSNSSSSSRVISRVRVVSALMSKALIRLDEAKHRHYAQSRSNVIIQMYDIRGRTIPPLPNHFCGNLVLPSSSPLLAADIEIQDLVDVISEDIEKTIDDCSRILLPGDGGKINYERLADIAAKLGGGAVNVITVSDWSKIGFREADFGWGKPVWARIGPVPCENFVVLMRNKEDDGGIEAWVHLEEDDVACFEQDEDIRLFASF